MDYIYIWIVPPIGPANSLVGQSFYSRIIKLFLKMCLKRLCQLWFCFRNNRTRTARHEFLGKMNVLGVPLSVTAYLFPNPPSVTAQVFPPTLFKIASVAAQVFPRSNSMSKVTGLWVSLSGWREGRLRVRGWSTQDRGGVCLLFSESPLRDCTSFPRHLKKNLRGWTSFSHLRIPCRK